MACGTAVKVNRRKALGHTANGDVAILYHMMRDQNAHHDSKLL
jgi:hypothetical protein